MVAADSADQALSIFKAAFPNNDRPRKAIEAAHACVSVAAARRCLCRSLSRTRRHSHVTTCAPHAATYADKARHA
jgi:hypothetical protein